MSFRKGKIVESFSVRGKDGKEREVAFRFPSMRDVKAALRLVNSVRDEAKYLGQTHHETVHSEREFIAKRIEDMRKRRGVFLFVEVNGELAGDSVINPIELDSEKHVGHFGIMLKEKYTGLGIGSRLIRKMLQLAKEKTRFKMIEASYNAKNIQSKKLHEKFGFKEYGRLPKGERLKNKTYCSRVLVYKVIREM